jgi:hypothetical protein
MKSIKLHTALKLKNRIAGEVARLQGVLARENSRRDDNPSKVDAAAVDAALQAARAKLVDLKAAISVANVPIYAALATMEETKAALAFYQALNTREGVETMFTHTGNVDMMHRAYLNREAVDALVTKLQEQINSLQDEVDGYNSATTIDV